MCGFDISHVRSQLQSMIKTAFIMDRKWNQRPIKSPPEGDLVTEFKKLGNVIDPKLPQGGPKWRHRGGGTLASTTFPHYGTYVLN